MNGSEHAELTRQLQWRVSELEGQLARRRVHDGYSRLYAALAVVTVVLSFLPLLADVEVESEHTDVVFTYRYGSLWQMAGSGGGEPAMLAILMLMALVTLLVVGAYRTGPIGVPIAIAAIPVPMLLMLAIRPGTGSANPGLTGAGAACVAVLLGMMALGTAHAVRLYRERQ